MQAKNTPDSYGAVTKGFHWVIALLIIGVLGVGLYMDFLATKIERFELMPWHKSFGITVLALATLRVLWHLYSRPARFVAGLKDWEMQAARAVHILLYMAMFVMPLSGWLMSSAAGRSVSFFKLFTLPDLVGKNDSLRELFGAIHEVSAYALLALIAGHAGAALKHHFIGKDATLRRMLPF